MAAHETSFQAYLDNRVRLINSYIDHQFSRYANSVSQRFSPLLNAMKYSLEGGGKRLRPLMMIASGEALGVQAERLLPAAAAMEFIHSYSLIHDDLPALDDDDTRRGKPASHKQFGEAVAILTGDALLTEAFGLMMQLVSEGHFDADKVLKAVELMVQQSGVRGMVGGQLLDVTTTETSWSIPEVEFIHIHKTGAMILGSVLMPTKLVASDEATVQKIRRYGEAVGLAFQISDDILDTEPSARYSRGPRKKPKPSYTMLMSPSEMREKLHRLIDNAVQSVSSLGDKATPLIQIAEFIRTRKS